MVSDFSANRNFGLDVVRASAILMVLVSHARQALVDPEAGLALTFGGWFGVELFFALSGFLIGTILIRLFDAGPTASSLGRFWFRRWMRTIPAYFFILVIYWLWFGKIQASDFILLQWPINHNQGTVPVSWSLAVEEWFYLLFPLLALIGTMTLKKGGLLFAILVAIIFPLLWRILQFGTGQDALAVRVNPFRFDGMAYGVLAAYLLSKDNVRIAFVRYWHFLALAAAVTFLADFWRYNGVRLNLPYSYHSPAWHNQITSFTVSGVSAALIVISFYLRSPHTGRIVSSVVNYTSKISYSLYLWHLLFFNYLVRYFSDYKGLGLYISAIVTSAILAAIPYIIIEQPFMRLRDYISLQRRQPDDVAATAT